MIHLRLFLYQLLSFSIFLVIFAIENYNLILIPYKHERKNFSYRRYGLHWLAHRS